MQKGDINEVFKKYSVTYGSGIDYVIKNNNEIKRESRDYSSNNNQKSSQGPGSQSEISLVKWNNDGSRSLNTELIIIVTSGG